MEYNELSARLGREERLGLTMGQELVEARQTSADLQGAVAQLLETVGSSQAQVQRERLEAKVRLQPVKTSCCTDHASLS